MDKEAMAEQDFTINVTLSDLRQQHVLHVKNGVLLVYENTYRDDADASITCPKNALLYILQNNVRALDAVPMEGNVELITLFAQSIRRMTGATADRFKLSDRGYIRPGCFADLTVFDEKEIRAAQPDQEKSFGIKQVFINGRQVLSEGTLDKEALKTTGRAIRVG